MKKRTTCLFVCICILFYRLSTRSLTVELSCCQWICEELGPTVVSLWYFAHCQWPQGECVVVVQQNLLANDKDMARGIHTIGLPKCQINCNSITYSCCRIEKRRRNRTSKNSLNKNLPQIADSPLGNIYIKFQCVCMQYMYMRVTLTKAKQCRLRLNFFRRQCQCWL